MKFNPGSLRPDDSDAKRDPVANLKFTVVTVVGVRSTGESRKPEEPTLTERVLLFLDRRAA